MFPQEVQKVFFLKTFDDWDMIPIGFFCGLAFFLWCLKPYVNFFTSPETNISPWKKRHIPKRKVQRTTIFQVLKTVRFRWDFLTTKIWVLGMPQISESFASQDFYREIISDASKICIEFISKNTMGFFKWYSWVCDIRIKVLTFPENVRRTILQSAKNPWFSEAWNPKSDRSYLNRNFRLIDILLKCDSSWDSTLTSDLDSLRWL